MTAHWKRSALLTAGLLACSGLFAQEADFDLATQRSESQQILRVPGRKLDHGGLVVNPTPHSLAVDDSRHLDLSGGLRIDDVRKVFSDNLGFVAASANGPRLRIDFGPGIADRNGVKKRPGAYVLRVDKKGIAIVGRDERGAFYGIQTLRQLLESPAAAEGSLPHLTVDDYPDLPRRGVVEGFYGTPWSHEVRLSLIDFYGKFKMNCYLYGPKDDPYHSCPDWRLPYPEKEAADIRELVAACNRNRVDFVWAIHPGQDIRWNEEDYGNLLRKFERMYDLGVRAFAIFFDDISGEGTNPERQTELLNRLQREFVEAKGDVASLIVCPTDYSRLWANPTPQGSLSIYGRTLDPAIEVFWTGDVVCSDVTAETMAWVNSRIARPAFFWWNYPVTDYVRHIVMQGPVYGLETSLTSDELCGLVSNPMEHGEASKPALYGVADYTWNTAAYNPIDNWERALAETAPEAKEAYRTFAIHSCDTETGYRRDESWETETFRIADCTPERYAALHAEFEKIERVPVEMEAKCSNALLLNELRPWLAEFGKLGTRGRRALEALAPYRSGDEAAFWAAYVRNLMSPEEKQAYESHKSGTLKLHPFYERAMDDMAAGFYERLAGERPAARTGIGSYANARTTLSKLMFDNDTTTYYTSGTSQQTGDWIGADLGRVEEVGEVVVLQGRNSVDDVDYFDHAVLECSADGTEWHTLADGLRKQYRIRWVGAPVAARYVRLRKLESEKTNWASVRSFEVNPVRAERIGFPIEAERPEQALLAFDRHPGTAYDLDGRLAFGIPAQTTAFTILSTGAEAGTTTLRQLAADGTLLTEQAFDAPFLHVVAEKDAAVVEIEGRTRLFEIIPR